MGDRSGGSWIAFAVMGVVIVGLAGVFATFALPVTMERALRQEAALDAALAAPDAAALAALRDRLGDSAASVIDGSGALATRVAAARGAMRERFAAEEQGNARRLRFLIVVVTLAASLFVGGLVGALARRAAAAP
jgi:hypothetical protein